MKWIAALLLLLAAVPCFGAEVEVGVFHGGNGVTTNTEINVTLNNNDLGAVYNSATLDMAKLLGPVVAEIVVRNAAYSTAAEVYGAVAVSIQPVSGSVDTGWSGVVEAGTGELGLTHIDGRLAWRERSEGNPPAASKLDRGSRIEDRGSRIED